MKNIIDIFWNSFFTKELNDLDWEEAVNRSSDWSLSPFCGVEGAATIKDQDGVPLDSNLCFLIMKFNRSLVNKDYNKAYVLYHEIKETTKALVEKFKNIEYLVG